MFYERESIVKILGMKLTLFLTGPLALLLLWDLLGGGRSNSAADKEDATAVGHIKWKDFVHELLAKGEVRIYSERSFD